MKLVLATRNLDKLREIKKMLSNENFEILSLRDFSDIPEIKENGKTLRENAIIKAREAAKRTGCISIADDSGLEVYELGGKPGVRSARFAGKKARPVRPSGSYGVDYAANNKKLLKLMKHLPREKRGACFRCVIAVAPPEGDVRTAQGIYEGEIALQPRGTNGFGYDPVFLDPSSGKTFAEMSFEEKNKISHRAKALSKAQRILKESV